MKSISTFVLIAFVVASTGCYNTHRVTTGELEKLNGYQAHGDEPELEAKDGTNFDFHSDVLLTLMLSKGGMFAGEFESVTVESGKFSGTTDEGESVSYELAEINEAEVEYLDGKRTGALVITAVVIGGAAVIYGLIQAISSIESH